MWGIGINWGHVALWRRWLIQWLIFVGVAVVLGWHLGPRPDEVAAAVFLPMLVLVPYALGCLMLVVVRVLLARPLFLGLVAKTVLVAQKCINFRARRSHDRLAG